MTKLEFRAPGAVFTIGTLLTRAKVPEAVAARAIRAGAVRVDDRKVLDPGEGVAAGARVVATIDAIEGDRLVAAPAKDVEFGWRALVPAPAYAQGELEVSPPREGRLEFVRTELRDGVAELVLRSQGIGPEEIREALGLAMGGVLGDARFGGRMVAGGLRLAGVRVEPGPDFARDGPPAPSGWWPDEPVFVRDASSGRDASTSLRVSAATLRAIAKGHPWVLADRETTDTRRFRPGTLVALAGAVDPTLVRVDSEGPLVARLWSVGDAKRGASVEARVARALARRRTLLHSADAPDGTDAFRLVHAEADGLPGLFVDRLGGTLRVLSTGRACEPVQDRVVDALVRALEGSIGPDPPVVEVVHLREAPAGRLRSVRLARGRLAAEIASGERLLPVRERGLVFEVDLGLGAPEVPSPTFGLFPDQRENRARLAAIASGGRFLNLFAHTGAFSVALLAAGASEVVSVDLSSSWLARLERAIERNGLDPERSRSVRSDARNFLERLDPDERFRAIVIDPPTAAAAGRRFWSVRKDLEPLVALSLARLAPGGVLLVCRNDRGGGRTLAALVSRAAEQAGVALAGVEPAPPAEDYPKLAGFPEGDPFEGLWVRVAGGEERAPGLPPNSGQVSPESR